MKKDKFVLKRIEENISNAENLSNPLDKLPSFTTFESKSNRFSSPQIEKSPNKSLDKAQTKKRKFHVQFYHSPLPTDLHESCMDLFKHNMTGLYKASSWGLDLDSKSEELRHESARFLIVTEENDTSQPSSKSMSISPLSRSKVRAFSHFRFEVNDDDFPTEEVIYLYEIQVHPDAQKCGIGTRCMSIIELVGLQTHMRKVLLTVFKTNHLAMQFYLNKMKYNIDDSSPSNYEGEDADYEILSKSLVSKGKRGR